MMSTRVVRWGTLAVLLSTASAHSRLKHDAGPLFAESSRVHSLNAQNYGNMLNDSDTVWLVDFYSPWCPHCRQFAPKWEEVANVYANVSNIRLGAVDCTKETEICNQEAVNLYPEVKIFHVPPKATEPITMPREDNLYASYVAKWIEEALKENGMQPGINVDEIYPENALRNDMKKKVVKFGDPVEPLHDDRSTDIRLKRLKDAGTTALFLFEDGLFMGTTVLEGERYEAAMTWVQALAASFPLKVNRDAFAKLVDAIGQQKRWNQADWNELISRWKTTANESSYPSNLFASKDDLALCTTPTCGLWTLFHALTVSDVDSQRKPSETMAAIRLVVKHFFGCEECRRHFLQANPESLLKKLALKDEDGPHAVAFWIWKMHNTVNQVLSKPMWPTKLSCPRCYSAGDQPLSLDPAQLNEEEIVAYIRSVYKFEDMLEQQDLVSTLWSSMKSMVIVALLIAIFAAAWLQQHKHRLIGVKAFKSRNHIA